VINARFQLVVLSIYVHHESQLTVNIFAPALTHFVNQSFASEQFPALFKVAQVTPHLKRQGLDKSQFAIDLYQILTRF